MVVVGADVHKRTHTFVAVDEVGRKLGEKVVAATSVRSCRGGDVGSRTVRADRWCGRSRIAGICRRAWSVTC